MRKREKQGEEWWSHNVAGERYDLVYCKGLADKDYPRWNYDERRAAELASRMGVMLRSGPALLRCRLMRWMVHHEHRDHIEQRVDRVGVH